MTVDQEIAVQLKWLAKLKVTVHINLIQNSHKNNNDTQAENK